MFIVVIAITLVAAIAIMASTEMEDQKRAENFHVVAKSVARFIR